MLAVVWNGFREWLRDTSGVLLIVIATLPAAAIAVLSVQTFAPGWLEAAGLGRLASREPRWLEVLGLVVALDAAILASWETREARKLVGKQIEKSRKDIEYYSGFLLTRRIAPFPACIDDVVKLIGQAREGEEIHVLCDVPGYGIWSAPERFERYFGAIRDAHARGVKIAVIVATGARRRQRIKEQFRLFCGAGADPERREIFESRLAAYNRRAGVDGRVEPGIQYDQFCEFIGALQDKLIPKFPFQVLETPSPIPLNLWIRTGTDHCMSIFTITAYGRGEELAFETRAAELVSSFRDVWDSYRTGESSSAAAASQPGEAAAASGAG